MEQGSGIDGKWILDFYSMAFLDFWSLRGLAEPRVSEGLAKPRDTKLPSLKILQNIFPLRQDWQKYQFAG